jgi:hypothetical protein
MPEFEVRPVDGGTTWRVMGDDEQEVAEMADALLDEDAYVYPAELPVGWDGTDPEMPTSDPHGPNRT